MSARHILVVDDERIVAAGIKNELESFGYEVSGVASTADDAVAHSVRAKPDLVLMDIHLKGDRDGIDAGQEIRARCGIPVVYLSAFADPETVARAAETEAYGYLLKPYEERELQTTIETALAKHGAEQRLAESERWMAGILAGIEDAVVATDPDNRVRFINLAGEALTGWRKADAVGRPLSAVCVLNDQLGPIPLNDLADLTVCESRGVELQSTTWLTDRTGREKPIEGFLSPIFDPGGEFIGMLLTLRDIGVRLELERARRQNEDQALRSQQAEAVRRLIGGTAHHLNSLLTVILGSSARALTQPPAEPQMVEALGRLDEAGLRAAGLIRRLLVFAGSGHAHRCQISLNDLLASCISDIEPLLDPRINIAYRPDPELWPVVADELQVGQALLNLCLNAQDAMPDGGRLTLESKNVALTDADRDGHPGGRPGEFVRVRVGDTGRGDAPEVRARLFNPSVAPHEREPGISRELNFVFAVIEQHHGWIECSDESDRGTRFDLYFPRFGPDAPTASAALPVPKARGAGTTILLAESEPLVRDFSRLVLEAAGYRVLVAEDGVQAIEVFRQFPEQIDLAVIDLNIPQLNAGAVFARLLQLAPNVVAIFSSGYFAEDRCRSGTHSAGVICKPYSRQELLRMVEHAVDVRSAADRA